MKGLVIAAALLSVSPAVAQDMLLTASPIPDGAETRFCYYAGLAYSENSYVLLTGNATNVQVVNPRETGVASGGAALARPPGQASLSREERLMECVRTEEGTDEGSLHWVARATMQANR